MAAKLVSYKENEYYVIQYINLGEIKLFVIDEEDYEKIIKVNKRWYIINGILSCSKIINESTVIYTLPAIIINNKDGYTIENITKNPNDMRKCNLRLVKNDMLNNSRAARHRNIDLPKNCGFTIDDIPKCVYYVKPSGAHGEYFRIEIKKNKQKKSWASSKSKKISLKDKLIEIKETLIKLSETYPELIIERSIIENNTREQRNIMRSFNKIIKLSDFDNVNDNLINIPKKEKINTELIDASLNTKKYIESKNIISKTGKRHTNNLPDDCDISPDMIPKYCHYRASTEKRGDFFVISGHPHLNDVIKWYTSTSKNISTHDKYLELLKKLKSINKKNKKSEKKITKKKKSIDEMKQHNLAKKNVPRK